jgi:hypothetical protein
MSTRFIYVAHGTGSPDLLGTFRNVGFEEVNWPT